MKPFLIRNLNDFPAGTLAIAYSGREPAPIIMSCLFDLAGGSAPGAVRLSQSDDLDNKNSDVVDLSLIAALPLVDITNAHRVSVAAQDLLYGRRLWSIPPANWPGHLVLMDGRFFFPFRMGAGIQYVTYFLDLVNGTVLGQQEFGNALAVAYGTWTLDIETGDTSDRPVYEPLLAFQNGKPVPISVSRAG